MVCHTDYHGWPSSAHGPSCDGWVEVLEFRLRWIPKGVHYRGFEVRQFCIPLSWSAAAAAVSAVFSALPFS